MRIFTISLAVFAAGLPAVSQRGVASWQTVSSSVDTAEEKFDVTVRDGFIYVSTSRVVTVKVYTILGQLVASQTLQPGTSRLHIKARGIYILKAGGITRRVTV